MTSHMSEISNPAGHQVVVFPENTLPCEIAKRCLLTDIKQVTIKKVGIDQIFLILKVVMLVLQDQLMGIKHHLSSMAVLIEADHQSQIYMEIEVDHPSQIYTEIEADHHMISNVLTSNETWLQVVYQYLITHPLIQSVDALDLHWQCYPSMQIESNSKTPHTHLNICSTKA